MRNSRHQFYRWIVGRGGRKRRSNCNPEDVGDITEAMQFIASNEERRAHLIRVGLKNAQRFDWSKNAEQVMATYCA